VVKPELLLLLLIHMILSMMKWVEFGFLFIGLFIF
jgi:hypothetical protein